MWSVRNPWHTKKKKRKQQWTCSMKEILSNSWMASWKCAFHKLNKISSSTLSKRNICIAFASQFFIHQFESSPSMPLHSFDGQCPQFIIQETLNYFPTHRKRAWCAVGEFKKWLGRLGWLIRIIEMVGNVRRKTSSRRINSMMFFTCSR